tara:strand:- start:55 stop:159 length:105 start_codon:yes stop_codon:yes gene_type:complete
MVVTSIGDFISFGFFRVDVAVEKTKCAKMCGGSR